MSAAEALARIEAFLEPLAPYRGGVSLASRSGRHLFLKDVRTVIETLRTGPHPCGHFDVTDDCGGCDPSAIEYVIDNGVRRPFDAKRDLAPRPPAGGGPDA